MALYTSEWTHLSQDTFFRRHELYTMSWAECVWTERTMVWAAGCGGPVAVCRDTSNSAVPIGVYNGAGESLGLAKWNGELACAGWSHDEQLILVDSTGLVSVYDMFGKLERAFSLGHELKRDTVRSAEVFVSHQVGVDGGDGGGGATGLAVLAGSGRFYLTTSLLSDALVLKKLPDPPGGMISPCWTVTADRYRSAILVANGRDLSLLEADSKPQPLPLDLPAAAQNITQLATNVNGDLLAVVTDSGHLVITSLDLRTVFCTVDTGARAPPRQLAWCGSYAAVALWKSTLLVVTRRGESVTYALDVTGHLRPECDCVRLITPHTHELIEPVWSDLVAALQIGSMEPAAVLLETFREYDKQSHRADEYLRMIWDKLATAVTSCIRAAEHEHDPSLQKLLLRAAQYGKTFVDDMDPEPFVSACRQLRVLNSLQHRQHGVALTLAQLRHTQTNTLLDRLMRRRLHFLAVRVCRHLQVPREQGERRVLEAWAKHKVLSAGEAASSDGRQVAQEIADRLGHQSGISFADVARTAISAGRRGTAVQLLALEHQARRTVPLLIELNMCDEALQRAAASGDPDLAHSALLQLRDARGRSEFLMLVHKHPQMLALYVKYLRARGQTETLRDVMVQEDDFTGQALLQLEEAYQQTRTDLKISHLVAAQDCFNKAKNEWFATQTEDQHKLLKYQSSLEDSWKTEFVGLSLHDTLKKLIRAGQYKLADSLRSEYNVPDKRFWWTKLIALVEGAQWAELDKFSRSKKSPIGYEPFVDVCLEFGNVTEAKKYLLRVSDDNKVKYHARCGLLEDAAKQAFEQKDREGLALVESMCGPSNRALLQQINQYKQALKF